MCQERRRLVAQRAPRALLEAQYSELVADPSFEGLVQSMLTGEGGPHKRVRRHAHCIFTQDIHPPDVANTRSHTTPSTCSASAGFRTRARTGGGLVRAVACLVVVGADAIREGLMLGDADLLERKADAKARLPGVCRRIGPMGPTDRMGRWHKPTA